MPIVLSATYDDFKFFSLDVNMGGFGFFNKDEWVYGVICFGLSAGFFGMAGWVLCLLFFSPVITSASFLFEIFIS